MLALARAAWTCTYCRRTRANPCSGRSLTTHNLVRTDVNKCSYSQIKVPGENGVIANQAAITEWQRRDVLARNYLIATIETLQQRALVNCRTANEMWVRLSTQHLQNAVENQHVLQQQFFEYRFQPDHDVMMHVTEIETMAAQLNDVGASVTPIQVMTKIICTLPPSYRNFISAWDSVQAADRTIELLTARLLKEETMSRRWTGRERNEADVAFLTRHIVMQPAPEQQTGSQDNLNTSWRGKSRGGSRSGRQRIVCTYCHKPWHLAKVCRKRLRHEAAANGAAKETDKKDSSLLSKTDDSSEQKEHGYMSSSCFLARNFADWFADSGATRHITDQRSMLMNFTTVPRGSWTVSGIGGTTLAVDGYGDFNAVATVGDTENAIVIKKVLYVPHLGANLLSIAAETDLGSTVTFMDKKVLFKQGEKVEMTGERVGENLYHMAIAPFPTQLDEALLVTKETDPVDHWHQRLAHTNYSNILKMASLQLVDGLNLPTPNNAPSTPCNGCAFGKMHKKSFSIGRSRGTHTGHLIHSDLCGPMQVSTPNGSRYFLLFTDDYSGWRTVYFLKNKSQTNECIKDFLNLLRGETGNFLETLRTDNGGEYCNNELQEWLNKKGVRHETSAPHTPEQNGVSERANRTVVEAARSMLHAKKLPLFLWGEAIACAVYTLNRVISKAAPLTPYYAWHKSKPDVSNLRIFGSIAFVHISAAERQKLDPKSVKTIFVGYSQTQKAHRFWYPVVRKVRTSRDATFYESYQDDDFLRSLHDPRLSQPVEGEYDALFPSISAPVILNQPASLSSSAAEEKTALSTPDERVTEEQHEPMEEDGELALSEADTISNEQPIIVDTLVQPMPFKRPEPSVTSRRYPLRYREPKRQWSALQSTEHLSLTDYYELVSFNDAVSCPGAKQWQSAITDEYNALLKNNTWSLTSLPDGRETIRSRWLFKVKPGVNGEPPRYKARLVAKGFTQRPGIDYNETYAPVLKMDSLRTVLALVADRDLEVAQLDITTAFLNGEISENNPKDSLLPDRNI